MRRLRQIFSVLVVSLASTFNYSTEVYKFGSIHNSAWNELCAAIISHAYDELGIPVEVNFLPSTRALMLSSNGELDGEIGRVNRIAELYPALIKVPVSYISLKSVVVMRNNSAPISAVHDLYGLRIGVLRGAVFSADLLQHYQPKEVDSVDTLFKMLINNRIDAMFITEFTAELEIAAKYPDADLVIAPVVINEIPIFHFLHDSHKDLIPVITDKIQDMVDTNQVEKIRQNFIKTYLTNSSLGL